MSTCAAADYLAVKALQLDSSTYGGQFDAARDSEAKLRAFSTAYPSKLLVATIEDKVVGTVTLFEDGRSAWLFRFAVQVVREREIARALYREAMQQLKTLGTHTSIGVCSRG